MKVKVKANELFDADVTQISLVKHGAMRSPFKIIKTEDLPTPDEKESGFLSSVFKHFGANPDSEVQIAAIYVKGDMDKYVKALSEAGLVAGHSEAIGDGVTLVKTDQYTEESLFPLSINEDIVLGLSGAEGLMKKMVEAREQFQDQLAHLKKTLPAAVYKLDELLNSSFEGSTVAETATETTTEVEKMDNIREAAPGDHDGLDTPVKKSNTVTSEELAAAAEKVAKGEDVVEKTDEKPADDTKAKDEDKEKTESETEVEKTETESTTTDEQDPLKVIADGLNNMFSAITGLTDRMEKQEQRIEEIAKSTKEEVEKAASVTKVVDWSMDESLSGQTRNRGGKVEKNDQPGMFDNLFGKMG